MLQPFARRPVAIPGRAARCTVLLAGKAPVGGEQDRMVGGGGTGPPPTGLVSSRTGLCLRHAPARVGAYGEARLHCAPSGSDHTRWRVLRAGWSLLHRTSLIVSAETGAGAFALIASSQLPPSRAVKPLFAGAL